MFVPKKNAAIYVLILRLKKLALWSNHYQKLVLNLASKYGLSSGKQKILPFSVRFNFRSHIFKTQILEKDKSTPALKNLRPTDSYYLDNIGNNNLNGLYLFWISTTMTYLWNIQDGNWISWSSTHYHKHEQAGWSKF